MRERPFWRPYTQEKTTSPPMRLERASGAHLFTDEGQRLFDGIASWWLTTHGHCHPAIVEAVQRQVALLDQATFANFSHDPAERLAQRLVDLTGLAKTFFSDNGSTAVEVALKLALQSHAQYGRPRKRRFVALAAAYHGDTVGAMSVSGRAFNTPYRATLFDVMRAEQPMISTASPDDFVRDAERIIAEHQDELAGLIIEPLVQGAYGMRMWPAAAVKRLATFARARGVYVIFDEVMTGFGRTGSMFACEQIGFTPDLLCLAKGLTGGTLPLAVTLATSAIYAAFFADEKAKMFFHGHSFTANPIACAAANASLDLFASERTYESWAKIERIHREELAKIEHAIDPRVCGTVAAFDIAGDTSYLATQCAAIAHKARERGLFIRPLGNTLYLMPPYCATEDDLRGAWDVLRNLSDPEMEHDEHVMRQERRRSDLTGQVDKTI